MNQILRRTAFALVGGGTALTVFSLTADAREEWHVYSEKYEIDFCDDGPYAGMDSQKIRFSSEVSMKDFASDDDVKVNWMTIKRPGTHNVVYIETRKEVEEYLRKK